MNDLLIKALKDIIEECPKPKLPYGMKVVEIATKALKDSSSGGYLDALLDSADEQEEIAKCDVLKCNESVCSQGSCWRNTGYWCVCREHSQIYRDGKVQPKMKKEAIGRENSRDENGYLPERASGI